MKTYSQVKFDLQTIYSKLTKPDTLIWLSTNLTVGQVYSGKHAKCAWHIVLLITWRVKQSSDRIFFLYDLTIYDTVLIKELKHLLLFKLKHGGPFADTWRVLTDLNFSRYN